MAYSYTEKKRIRKSFAKLPTVMDVPYLLAIQVDSYEQFLQENNLESTFSEIVKLLKLIVTIPMTTSEAERCFSTLKRIKTFLRSSMTEERLTALAMLSIEKDFIRDIPDFNEAVIDKFAEMKERRMDFMYKQCA